MKKKAAAEGTMVAGGKYRYLSYSKDSCLGR